MSKSLPLSLVLLAASTAVSAQTYSVLYTFSRYNEGPVNFQPPGIISQSRGGALFTSSMAEAFRMWPDGNLNVVHRFSTPDGLWAYSGFTLAVDGQYYGTTLGGNSTGYGMIYKMTQDGVVTDLHDFTAGFDGYWAAAPPIQSVEGDFYGTTAGVTSPPNSRHGTVYRITKDGHFTLLHTFYGNDGGMPETPLVQGTDFYFYGTTLTGGKNICPSEDFTVNLHCGTIFRVSSTGDFKVLVNFDGKNGMGPRSGLIQANDGNFYGVTAEGGQLGQGVLYRLTPDGTLTVLHNFTKGSDGGLPVSLMQASDGNLYGIAARGGKNYQGVIFRATLAGDVVPIHDFDSSTSYGPTSALFQHTNGKFYGIASGGGADYQGVFYSLDAGLPPFVTYLPTYGREGALVQILGQGFTADSEVSFGGTPATSPVIVYPTYLRVVVPPGATTGPITVTTSNGTLTSNKTFIVHPN